jgi:sigma-B regulation protein RsbU (phosphoserine phosphatase)
LNNKKIFSAIQEKRDVYFDAGFSYLSPSSRKQQPMDILNTDYIREQLQERRTKLQQAIPQVNDAGPLRKLLNEVDIALEKIAKGTYGQCETCHDAIEPERLIVDPLIRNCLDHLTAAEQRALEHDLDLAREVQKNLLPKQGLRLHGWEAAYLYEPAGSVSGDYCDLIDVGDSFYFFIGDVSGKGVAASILMAHLHAIFRSLVHAKHTFHHLMNEANRLFCEGTLTSLFATLVCGRANSSGTLEIANAGHAPPLIVRNGGIEAIPPTGIPIGMFCNSEYTTQQFHLDKGDVLVLYTDGVTEARNTAGEFYGEQRLTTLLNTNAARACDDLLKLIVTDVRTFLSGQPKGDDLTVMVVRRG